MSFETVIPGFTICFVFHQDRVLLLHRNAPPNANRWNGLGGKLEVGETPHQAILREVYEESGLQLQQDHHFRCHGIVTWVGNSLPLGGMYLFSARLEHVAPEHLAERITREGTLKWHPLTWAMDPDNRLVPTNLGTLLSAIRNGNPDERINIALTYEEEHVTIVDLLTLSDQQRAAIDDISPS
jgi:8-oxo-dGTP diphosphatase